ncbi:MAG TPA: ergothioneine biosynthesis protein EgtB [Gammaproteobacteria bacterium]|nr:ergothioneine biosynthesis protein EgtB [Gammaproteobacteria bacterium]
MPSALHARDSSGSSVVDDYLRVRAATVDLCRGLEPEDYVVQSMPDVSPTKWHLAHTSWFFEHFVLEPHARDYRVFDPAFNYLFNSYYYTVGAMHPRPQRGMLSRPTVATVVAYRRHVDDALAALLVERTGDSELESLVTLGINHEQQHQELLLTDIKHVFSVNPLKPAWRELDPPPSVSPLALAFVDRPAETVAIGHDGPGFCFDNETPRHDELMTAHAFAQRPVTNGEFCDFVRDGGYDTPELWLSDGWATIQSEQWRHPLYWSNDLEREFTLGGMRGIDLNAPVAHVSYYEADAFARWAGARLPTETEWESAAAGAPVAGNLADAGVFQPIAASRGASQLFGDVWEWTSSPYVSYPGFKPLAGSLGEYNGKFMCNQMVVRGGSCVTPADHIRASYRSFFPPAARWQFTGFRLAKDL